MLDFYTRRILVLSRPDSFIHKGYFCRQDNTSDRLKQKVAYKIARTLSGILIRNCDNTTQEPDLR
jgi:hypothetical protein